MAKTTDCKRIYGCPKHGTRNGAEAILKTIDKGMEVKTPCFRCDQCKRVYIESNKIKMGDTNYKVKKYSIWNIVGPLPLPNKIYIYEKYTKKGLCECSSAIKKKEITDVLLKDGNVKKVSGIKLCLSCKRIFLTEGTYKNYKKLFDYNNIQVTKIDTEYRQEIKPIIKNSTINVPMPLGIGNDWENDVFDVEYHKMQEKHLEELTPANRVASAYYDAKISYNPYQYLPWLKMFINGAHNILISDEVGLGKTIEAGILIMEELTENVNAKIVVLCPAFLREKWYQELNEKFLLDCQIYDAKTSIDTMTNIVILPISKIKQYLEKEDSYQYSMVVVDEVHYFKNANSKRHGYLHELLEKIGHPKRVFMSATPVNNSGSDYYAIRKLLSSKADRTNTTKKQAYIYLPERIIEDIYVDLTKKEQQFYDATDSLDPFSGTIYRHIGASCLYALSRYAYSGSELTSETKEELRNSLELLFDGRNIDDINDDYFSIIKKIPAPDTDSKIKKLKELIGNYKAGSKIVIFSHYIETVKYLYSELIGIFNVGYIYANTISNNISCKNIKNKFIDVKNWFEQENDQITILICSDTCREGIDLDMANVLINYDLPFNPSILEQRIGRIDRMSQKKDMYIYNFHVNGTYDDRLHFILAAKLRFINFYANYGIGNPLNINADGNHTFDNFIRYFGRTKDLPVMSNDDYYVTSHILRQIGIKLEKEPEIDGIKMQNLILDKLHKNQKQIEEWFNKDDIKKITEEQLLKQKEKLEKLLNFPKKIQRRIEFDDVTLQKVVNKANTNPQFRKRISMLIIDYSEKLREMEISGMPMHINITDLRTSYSFGTKNSNDFIQNSVIELLRNEGANVYEIK